MDPRVVVARTYRRSGLLIRYIDLTLGHSGGVRSDNPILLLQHRTRPGEPPHLVRRERYTAPCVPSSSFGSQPKICITTALQNRMLAAAQFTKRRSRTLLTSP